MKAAQTVSTRHIASLHLWQRVVACVLCVAMLSPMAVFPQDPTQNEEIPPGKEEVVDSKLIVPLDSVARPLPDNTLEADTLLTVVESSDYAFSEKGRKEFNPDPERAVWLSALFPGLGQVYNRRYWKLPIVVGGFMGLIYATSWNNNQYQDYSQGYRDLMSNDPNANSYMNFFPPNTNESDLDKTWLTQVMKSRKDFYRRNRDLCIISMVGLYLICMVDAYVDASLAHFNITPDLSLDWQPAIMIPRDTGKVAVGMAWAFTF